MPYRLFLDDERFPPDSDPEQWVICRTVPEAVSCVQTRGVPYFISFDHDLGPDIQTGYDFAKWLVDQDLDGAIDLNGMKFYVHSQNNVGAANIGKLLLRYFRFKDGD